MHGPLEPIVRTAVVPESLATFFHNTFQIFIVSVRRRFFLSNASPLARCQPEVHMSTDRVFRWILTGNHTFETAFVNSKAVGSTTKTDTAHDDILKEMSRVSVEHIKQTSMVNSKSALTDGSSEGESLDKLLTGHDNDPLRPNSDQINYTFLRGERIWRTYFTYANSLPSGWMPEGWLAPYTLMQDIPPLPQDLPRQRFITGQALWHVPHPELPRSCQQEAKMAQDDDIWNPNHVYNFPKEFSLTIDKPVECRIRSRRYRDDEAPDSIAILTLCWAYMFTVRFLEMQKRPIRYSSTRLTPVLFSGFKAQPGDIVVYLKSASRYLIRWLCALLAPGLGWIIKGPLPPWAAHYDADTHFVIATDVPFNFLDDDRPPSSEMATDLLIEFCRLHGFESQAAYDEKPSKSLPQPTAGFLAAFALPFYSELNLQPWLPVPKLIPNPDAHSAPLDYILDYMKDLPYFMTLSISPASVGSVIWSIFWEPGLDCNLVSAWFGSILEVVTPVINAGDTKMLSSIFALRRERVGILWRAIFDLGDLKVLDMIVSYLESHEERLGGSLSWPDIDVATWTGSPQSFLDERFSGAYQGMTTQIPRSDLLRHRFNFRLGDPDPIRFGWQPPGYVPKEQIEPELWPALELGRPREYKYWVWWLKDEEGHMIAKIQQGFKHEESKYVEYVDGAGRTDTSEIAIPSGFVCKVGLAPSFEATWSTINYGAREASGDRSLEAILINGIREHPWFVDSRGI